MNLLQRLVETKESYINCVNNGNKEWQDKWEDKLSNLLDMLPSGSGIDTGLEVDIKPSLVTINGDYHAMNEHGMYTGYIAFTITIEPAFIGFVLGIEIHDKDHEQAYGLDDYLGDLFYENLSQEVE